MVFLHTQTQLDSEGQVNVHAMVQYYFQGPIIPVLVKPHGNSICNKPFFRTTETAKEECRQLATKHSPSEVVSIMTGERGGEVHLQGAGSVARDQMQIKNFRRTSTSRSDNALHAVMLECKLAQGKTDAFVRDVKAAPEPMSVCYADWQLRDLERFCTNSAEFTILTADTTYNLGDFFVTPLSYRHLMLEDVRSGEPPVMPGPTLVHQQMKFASFNYLASVMIDGNKKLRNLQAFGTDGDTNLSEALGHNFPFALSLRCFIHFERNLHKKLHDLGIPKKVADEFVHDVMGSRHGSTYQEGLVDCITVAEFDQNFARLETVWNAREKPFSGVSAPQFYQYFKQHKADAVRYNMLKGVREAAGLGSPPAIFTTNASESLNKVIKQHVHYKASQWPDFNDSLRSLVAAKREEVIRAISGRGLYRLRPQYARLGVDHVAWQRKRPDQCKKLIRQFDECSLFSEQITGLSTPSSKPCTDAQSAIEQAPSSSGLSDHARGSCHVSISPAESGITSLHQSVLQPVWEKAERLLNRERGLHRAASSDPTAWSVQSLSSAVPHFVTSKADGQVLCDAQCPQWVSTKICSHTVAMAERSGKLAAFLKWYVSTSQETNVTNLGMLNMPKGRGQKGGIPKRKRSRAKASEPEVVVSRPSLRAAPSTGSCSGESSGTHPLFHINSPTFHYSTMFEKFPPASLPPAYDPLVYGYPYHSSPVLSTQPTNPNPFYLKFVTGNIRTCQGCKGSLRSAESTIPEPPYNICIARAEKRPYRDTSGNLVTPTAYKPSHYHLSLTCIHAVEPTFAPHNLKVPSDVQCQLSPEHKHFIGMQMGIWA